MQSIHLASRDIVTCFASQRKEPAAEAAGSLVGAEERTTA